MKNLENIQLKEISQTELINIEGGNWFTDALEALEELVVNKVQEVIDEVMDTINEHQQG
ncbi:hypothetical protein J8L88_02605 [Aquimarina sp. MMG015]|uniref:hypothetical protein n=1 Tax=Aquimarina sp. MMG015 TaxID=2822689 RepID=UPI001B3A7363|nr:hypothetical protein [Aquimarina sp. MMG015]MBQ4801727.1 hypothetical protein [Aquimarina sp. MMG015]